MNFMDIIDELLLILSKNYILSIAFSYLILKILIKTGVRNLIKISTDYWEISVWFSIDVLFIALSYSILKVPKDNCLLEYKVLWFVALAVVGLLLIGFYAKFIERQKLHHSNPFKDIRLFMYISVNYFFSFGSLVFSYKHF